MVVFVMQTRTNEAGEYQVCIAVEGEKGFHPTDWFWGTDYEKASELCDKKNAEAGYTKEEAS
jgi:hypothetical protein